MASQKNTIKTGSKGATTVNTLVAIVFFTVTILASLLIYGAYLNQRDAVVSKVGLVEARQTAGLIYEHLYSVMRKGWTTQEIDDLIHHVGNRLPDYQIDVVRSEAVAKQFGDTPGDAIKRRDDSVVAKAISERKDIFQTSNDQLRYGFAVKMKEECSSCHTTTKVGDINGVILISIPNSRLRKPIEDAIKPMTAMLSVIVLVLFGTIFLVLRARVVKPVLEFSSNVGQYSDNNTEKRISPMPHWPNEIVSLAKSFNFLMDRIQDDQKLLEKQSQRDALTGLSNRRHFDEFLLQAKNDAENGADIFSVLLLDLDGFKPVNDSHGHAAGDAILVAVAHALRNTTREADLPARIGGDEFAVIAVATDENAVKEFMERIRFAISEVKVRFGHINLSASCSIGAATYHSNIESASDLLQAADAAMYEDKISRKAQR